MGRPAAHRLVFHRYTRVANYFSYFLNDVGEKELDKPEVSVEDSWVRVSALVMKIVNSDELL